MTSRPFAPILAVVVILALTLGVYLGGYFWLGEYSYNDFIRSPHINRFFLYEWQTTLFRPAAWIESQITGEALMLRGPDGPPALYRPWRSRHTQRPLVS